MLSKETLKNSLKALCEIDGVPGHEQEVIKYVLKEISSVCDEVRVTPYGNVIAMKKGSKPGPAVAVAAHMDQIGFIVKAILPGGFLMINKVGGSPNNILPARKVWVGQNRIPGVIGMKPGHLQTPEEASKAPTIEKCYVDIGVASKEEAESLGITIGTPITYQSDFMEMHNPDLICTRSLDDRICCAVLIELLKNLDKNDFAGTFYGIFTVKEEVGLWGAKTAIYGLPVDYVISIDTIPCADTPDIGDPHALNLKLGGGPVMAIAEGNGARFNMVVPALRKIVEDAAKKRGKNLQICSVLGISIGTDSAAFAHENGGTPAADSRGSQRKPGGVSERLFRGQRLRVGGSRDENGISVLEPKRRKRTDTDAHHSRRVSRRHVRRDERL